MRQHKLTQGSALLTSLFIMTLVAIVATAMSTKLQIDIYRTRLVIAHDKLYFASQGVAFWALGELGNKKNTFNKINEQNMISQYPQKISNIYPTVTITGELYDLQSFYNLNNLKNRKAILGFINLLGGVAPKTTDQERKNLALALNNWLSPYDLARGKDNYLSHYLSQKPPYYPSHQLLNSRSELRLIKDVTPEIYKKLEPFIIALPEATAINFNTAPKQVLMTLSNAIDAEKVELLLNARGKNGIKNIKKISELMKKLNIAPEQITFDSMYFLSVAHASTDNLQLTVYTFLKKTQDKKGKLSVNILRESFNVF